MKRPSVEMLLIISLMGHGVQLIGKFLPSNQPAFAASHSSEIIVNEKCKDVQTGRPK
ncbi:MAG TPA: hypothetical protein V6C58_22250 [Allocoleopsis sp.]